MLGLLLGTIVGDQLNYNLGISWTNVNKYKYVQTEDKIQPNIGMLRLQFEMLEMSCHIRHVKLWVVFFGRSKEKQANSPLG